MPSSNRRQITLGEVLDAQAFALLGSIYKVWPGIVTAYHASSAGTSPAEVDVQPAVNDVRLDTVLGALVSEPWPIVPNVPVAFFKAGGFAMTAPLKAGDVVTLLSYDLDPSTFRATGNQSNPVDTRRHGGGYWVALPFDITDPGALTDPGANNLQFLAPAGGTITFGAGATDMMALASLVTSNLNKIANAFAAATPSSSETGLSSIKTALSSGFPVSVASALVKSK